MIWGYFVRKHSQQISIGYNARLAVIIVLGRRMDLPSNGYPKRSPGVSDGSLLYALAITGQRCNLDPLWLHATVSRTQ